MKRGKHADNTPATRCKHYPSKPIPHLDRTYRSLSPLDVYMRLVRTWTVTTYGYRHT
uniref:Uncharacterized protein n=1 Tax=Cucumis melo TaxID=3656 RepID=A0A9I9E6Z6_CUCME